MSGGGVSGGGPASTIVLRAIFYAGAGNLARVLAEQTKLGAATPDSLLVDMAGLTDISTIISPPARVIWLAWNVYQVVITTDTGGPVPITYTFSYDPGAFIDISVGENVTGTLDVARSAGGTAPSMPRSEDVANIEDMQVSLHSDTPIVDGLVYATAVFVRL